MIKWGDTTKLNRPCLAKLPIEGKVITKPKVKRKEITKINQNNG